MTMTHKHAAIDCPHLHLGVRRNDSNLERAMTVAREYLRLDPGRTAERDGCARDIDELVGYWDCSGERPVWRIPAPVREAMGLTD